MGEHEIYLEFRRVGNALKVTAIDGKTGVEVITFGPLSVSQHELGQLAVRKLKMRLGKADKELF
jgi:hypothetical protein